MIETIGLSALNEIKNIKGFENAVIAGGAVRDRLLNGPIKDLDIFVPCSSNKEFMNKLTNSKLSNFSEIDNNYVGYEKQTIAGKVDCKYIGKIDVDIMAVNLPNDENFGENVVKDFCYKIDQAYYDGRDIVTTKGFDRDAKFHEATLWYLKKIEDLPRALAKFVRLQQKYPSFTWRQTCLELKTKEKEIKNQEEPKIRVWGEREPAVFEF